MKNKLILPLLFSALVVLNFGCRKKAGPLSCAAATVNYSEEITRFVENQNKANCERVLKSIKEIYSGCGGALTGLDRQAYEEAEADLNCDDFN